MTTINDIIHAHQEPHGTRGLSSCGLGAGNQILNKRYPDPDALPYGIFQIGKEGHRYFQTHVFRDGEIIYDLDLPTADGKIEHFDKIEIMGHEQDVYLMIGKTLRKSPMDTVILNHDTGEFEIWDYKFKGPYTFKPLKQMELANMEQVNLYANVFQKMLAATTPYKISTVRVLYVMANNWSIVKLTTSIVSPRQFALTLNRLNIVDQELKEEELSGKRWLELIDECISWKWCKYCKHQNTCLENCGAELAKPITNLDQVRMIMARNNHKKNALEEALY